MLWPAKPISHFRHPNLSNQDDPNNVRVLAKAIYSVRTGDESVEQEVAAALDHIQGTERRADMLALGRELAAYVIAADIIQLEGEREARFKRWLSKVVQRTYQGRSITSTHEDRPNNWGTHAGATRIAIAIYLTDHAELERAAHVFRGWTGEQSGWARF